MSITVLGRSLSGILSVLITAAGFTGCREEIVNSPPEASLAVFPYAGDSLTIFTFDASKSSDKEDVADKLTARWDWDGDGRWDTDFEPDLKGLGRFPVHGFHTIRIEVADSYGTTDTASCRIRIFDVPLYGTLTDQRDGINYQTVRLEGRWWMAENLRYGRMIGSDNIQTDNGIAEFYGYNNDNGMALGYGGLYTWYEAMDYRENEGAVGLCPPGWHLPSLREWRAIAPDDVPYLFLNYFLGPGGPGGLNLLYGGRFILYTEKNRGIIQGNLFNGFGRNASFWTSTTRENALQTFTAKAIQRSNYGVSIMNPRQVMGIWDGNGLFSDGDLIHLSGDTLVYDQQGTYKHYRVAISVRCIKSE